MAADQYGTNTTDEDMEVLTRGPIHEAFAEVSVDEEKPEMVISQSVPEPINEIPPEYRPEGGNVQWIPGYWSWDDDQNDFIWVSGVWRDLPPGRQWVPGYWTTVAGGSHYVSGYWSEPNQTETAYLPPPPEPPSTAPGVPASSADNIWVDGHWLWSHNGYVWQSGYWLRQRPEMAWIPAHYVWTPRGHIFVPGYWDYQLVRRGVMFAPRYYARPIYREHGYYYTPSIVLHTDAIFLSLFVRQHHHHYYFGDYHDVRYERRGYIPWYSRHATRHGHDPYYRSYRWYQSRHDDKWEHNYRRQFEYRRDHREARPPVRYRSQVEHNGARPHDKKYQMLGRSYAEVVKNNGRDVRFVRSRPDDKKDYRQQGKKVTPQQVERRPVYDAAERKDRSWEKKTPNTTERRNRAAVSENKGNAGQVNSPKGQQRREKDYQHVKPNSQVHNQPNATQPRSQPQQKIRRTDKGQPRIDQQQIVPLQRSKQPGISSHGNQPQRIDPKNDNHTTRQPQKTQEKRKPMIYEGQKNTERQPPQQQRNIATQGQNQKSSPVQVQKKGKGPAGTQAQVEGQEEVVLANGQIIMRPRSVQGKQANRSDQK